MKRAWLGTIVLTAGITAAHAQQVADCSTAKTQAEINACMGADFAKADKELNSTFQLVLKKYSDDPAFLSKLRASQRAWLKFRDAELAAVFPHTSEAGYYGSSYPTCRAGVLARLTADRTQQLRRWLDGADEGDTCAGSVKSKSALADSGKK